jgi:hypothetical protein
MGRALKIQKTGSNGITINANGTVNTPAASVPVDQGFPNFGSLTDPVYNSPVQTLTSANYLGVVGGTFTTSTPSATYPEIYCLVNITLANGTNTYSIASQYGGRIIRQKGSHKFLVAYTYASTAPSALIVGQAYQIGSVGTTNWQACGAPAGAAVGDIFTVTAVGSGNGYAYPVGQCVLSNTATPSAGNMSISYSVGDSVAVYASYITNKWVRDWTGMTYQNYSNSNLGPNIQSNENFYVTNFFTDEGTVTWSGAEVINSANAQNGSLQLAQIASTTS